MNFTQEQKDWIKHHVIEADGQLDHITPEERILVGLVQALRDRQCQLLDGVDPIEAEIPNAQSMIAMAATDLELDT